MHIAQVPEGMTVERLQPLYDRITAQFPSKHWPRIEECLDGSIESTFASPFTVYYHHNLAVLNPHMGFIAMNYEAGMAQRREYVSKLEAMGLRVPAASKYAAELSSSVEDCYLWNELLRGPIQEQLRSHLTALLRPITSRLPAASTLEFVVYSPQHNDENQYGKLDSRDRAIISLPLNDCLESHLADIAARIAPDEALGISSRVTTPSGVLHMPMIDFVSSERDPTPMLTYFGRACDSLKFPRDYFVLSGTSYHAYDPEHLLPWQAMKRKLAKMKKNTWIGKRWPAYCMRRKYLCLRLTPCATKPFYPEFIGRNSASLLC